MNKTFNPAGNAVPPLMRSEWPRPRSDELQSFEELTEKLSRVSKQELDEKRKAES